MIRNRWQPSLYISFMLTISPASFNFCLTGQPNDEKKEDGLEIYIVPQDSSNTKYTGSCLLKLPIGSL